MKHLNRLHRAGVALSVLWFVVVGGYQVFQFLGVTDRAEGFAAHDCRENPWPAPSQFDDCMRITAKLTANEDARTIRINLAQEFAVIPLVSILAYLSIWTIRWVSRGEMPKISQ
jgi:hypothetical protein